MSTIVCGCLLAWASPVHAKESLVALGDSYSSGEGAPPFAEGTDKHGNSCHRSKAAFPLVLAKRAGWSAISYACSGATTADVVRSDGTRKQVERRTSQIARIAGRRADVITLTIGGNDVGFRQVLEQCIKPGKSCERRYTREGLDELDARIGVLETQLPGVYGAVRAAVPGARLVVVGYPRIFPADPGPRSCTAKGWISVDEMRYLNTKQDHLDAAIRRAATHAGAIYMGVGDAFQGHEIACHGKAWVNNLNLRHLSYSFHPNKDGAKRLGLVVERRLQSTQQPGTGTLPPQRELDLARRFRPILMLAEKEPWRPLDVDRFFAEGWHQACRRRADCDTLPDAADLTRHGVSNRGAIPFLQVDGLEGLGGEHFTSRARSCGRPECVPGRVYYHLSEDADQIYIDYWWYLRFNDSPGGSTYDHQSDWEGVVVALDKSDTSSFAWVGFAAHDTVWRYLRGALSCDGETIQGSCGTEAGRFGRRVNVFVAKGTHAAYPASCKPRTVLRVPQLRLPCRQNAHFGPFRIPEGSVDGGLPWHGNRAVLALAPLGAWAWWPGFWDPSANVESPYEQTRFRSPGRATATDCPPDACRYVPPVGFERACRGWFGLDVVAATCDGDFVLSGARGTSLLRLRRGLLDPALPPPIDVVGGQDVPGLAQLVGAPLQNGESLTIAGSATADTDLFVRAASGSTVHEARFTDLGLEHGGTATVSWSSIRPRGGPEFVLHSPNGSTSRARAVVAYRAPG